PADQEENVLALIAALGGPQELALIFKMVIAKDATPAARRTHLLEALARAARQRGVRPAGELAWVSTLLASDHEPLRCAAARIIGLWHIESQRNPLQKIAAYQKTSKEFRRAAIDGLALLGGKASQEALDALAGNKQPLQVRRMAVVALTQLD